MDAVRSLVAQVSSAKDEIVPNLLLGLKETLHTSRLESKQRESAFRLIWQSDLIHVMVGVTRKDFSRLVGGWDTAAQLADLLATVCSGLKPQETSQKQKRPAEGDNGVKDFYEKLLPTAVDSLLILANSLIEHTATSTAAKSHIQSSSSVLQLFESVLASLSRLCSSHRQCAFKAIQSPYILCMITSSQPHYCLALVTTLNQLVKMDRLLSTVGHPQSTLDVLAHKLTSTDNEELRVECLKLLALFIGSDSDALTTLCSKYTALTSVVLKSKRCGLGKEVDLLVQRLEVQTPRGEIDSGVNTESPTTDVKRKHTSTYVKATSTADVPNADQGKSTDDVAEVHHSATVIQACWRGYTDRKLLRRMKERTEPQCKDMGKEQEEFDERSEKIAAVTKKLQSLSEMRTFHERQMLLLEQLPAGKVTSFLHNQQTNAAKKIQSWWRKTYDQERLKRRGELLAAVVVIQRAVRRFLKGREKSEKLQQLSDSGYPPVEGQEREDLQREIARYREERAPLERSEAEMRQTHDEVQQLLCDFYPHIRNEASEAERKQRLLLKLEQDCTLLLEAPRLNEVSDEVVERFLSGSHTVAMMARQAHHEELRASQLPWWKLPPSTTEGELLQLLN